MMACFVMCFILLHFQSNNSLSLSLTILLGGLIGAVYVFSWIRKYTYVRYRTASIHQVADRIIRLKNDH